MKIQLPAIRIENVGIRRNYGVDLHFHAADRPNITSPIVETPILEPKLYIATVFDKDLKVAARATAAGQLVAYSALFGVTLPLVAIYVVGGLAAKGIEVAANFLMDTIPDAMGIPPYSVGSTFRALADRVVQK